MFDYEEVCPISKASSVLCERWTLQILREMFFGASRFSEFQRYLPKLSPSLLNTRLKTLADNGIIVRRKVPEMRGYEYQLTPTGKALRPVLAAMSRRDERARTLRAGEDDVPRLVADLEGLPDVWTGGVADVHYRNAVGEVIDNPELIGSS